MTPAELAARLARLDDRIRRDAAKASSDAMAFTGQRQIVKSMHGPAPSPKGTPPARRSGTLARSLRVEPAFAGVRATAKLAPHTVYARIQQFGGTIRPVRAKALRWKDASGVHFAKRVTLPKRPYMKVTDKAAMRRAGVAAIQRVIGGG